MEISKAHKLYSIIHFVAQSNDESDSCQEQIQLFLNLRQFQFAFE